MRWGTNLMREINGDGFRRWYERQLIGGFSFIALGLLLIVAGAAFLEVWLGHESATVDILSAGLAFASLGSGGYCWVKAAETIGAAEHLAQQAVCASCKAYGRIDVVSEMHANAITTFRAQCRRCSHEWGMSI